ncbi:hypothetical protein EWM64_g9364 [Hericium alpestre]|uniref:Uncharacterized protein n=1 Tax=Hericium alpestre TaxID=135208 RepID=A0A4Y9ZKT0_9AGAM|nr:hypothetical protein EWM64_g9364 [Hericium alpestre]
MGSRYFPHHGYLGLTPITVQGSVCTRIDSDGKPLSAKSLTVAVRCYETRHGLRGAADSAPLADFEASFRITVPRDAPGHSTAYYQDYRVFWRVESLTIHTFPA